MKRTLSLLCVVLLLCSTVLLVGCGINGTYQLVNASGNNSTLSATDFGVSATLTVKDKTATYSASYSGESGSQVWVVDTKNKTLTDGDNNVWNYEASGKNLTLTRVESGQTISMLFVKVS